jgi:hypothetical protein
MGKQLTLKLGDGRCREEMSLMMTLYNSRHTKLQCQETAEVLAEIPQPKICIENVTEVLGCFRGIGIA